MLNDFAFMVGTVVAVIPFLSILQHGECMRVVYRMRGLLGDATEDIVERLDNGKDRDVDEEEDYKMAAVLSRCNGLDAILTRLAHIKDFVQGHQLISAALKLLGFCIKLKVLFDFVSLCFGMTQHYSTT